MLKDLRELFEEDENEFETLEDARRRTIILAGAVGGGVILILLICFAGYALLIGPRRSAARQTQVADNQTQIAGLNQVGTEGTNTEGQTGDVQLPAPTRTRIPSPTPKPTDSPTLTPSSLPTDTPTRPTITPTASSTASPTSAPTTTPEIVFFEDYEGSGGAWPPADEETYSYGTSEGGYRIIVKTFFVDIYSVRNREFTDVRLELDVKKTAGPDDGYAGLICRFQNSGNYYGFVVSGDGSYRIYKKSGGVIADIGDPGQGSIVRTGDATNQIRADCVGSTLTLYVNGEIVLERQDEEFIEGLVGLVVGTQANPDVNVLFDNFLIANP
jgi:hypothetical protein